MNGLVNLLSSFAPALTVIGSVIGVLGAGISSVMLKRRISSEQRLVNEIFREYAQTHRDELSAAIRSIGVGKGSVPDSVIEAYVWHIKRASQILDEGQRALVVRALEQPSESGRKAYVSKIIRETSMHASID